MRNRQPYIEGRIENLHVRILRQEIETLVLFEIDGVRFRMRCRSFSFKQGDLVRVKYCKQGYLGSLVALEVERRRTPLEYARDFALIVLDAARRALYLVWDILTTFGLIFFVTAVFYAIYLAPQKDAFSNLGDFFYTCAELTLVAMIILAYIYAIVRAIERRAPRLVRIFWMCTYFATFLMFFTAVFIIALVILLYVCDILGFGDYFFSCLVLAFVCSYAVCSTCMQKLSSWCKRRKK
ncbi:hypothetical protein [uncultured Campylobacter sp.]|uniref:hypothetical protein n=1 Tax=uncultured Campylobacter sp. TaxID=218934 RepID=UPI00261FC924|nr:hypothetical protein [uncultured Campylobacter sp.]